MFPARRNVYNPEWASLLRDSLPHLWDGTTEKAGTQSQICFACIYGRTLQSLICLRNLQDEICSRLTEFDSQCSSFAEWHMYATDKFLRPEELQQARREWMLDMVEEFSIPPAMAQSWEQL